MCTRQRGRLLRRPVLLQDMLRGSLQPLWLGLLRYLARCWAGHHTHTTATLGLARNTTSTLSLTFVSFEIATGPSLS